MEMAGGRTTDFLIGTKGEYVSGVALATYAITELDGVSQVQIIQEDRTTVRVKVVRGPSFSASTAEELVRRFQSFLGSDMNISIERVESVPLSVSGKHRFSICKIRERQ